MIAILTIVAALPLGYFVQRRTVAYVAYAIAFAHVYTFQTANLLREQLDGSGDALGTGSDAAGYFVLTTTIYAAGFGLVTLGHWLRSRRRAGHNVVRVDA